MKLTSAQIAKLITRLDSQSVREGDEAADTLADAQCFDAIIDAIVDSQIVSSRGKIRATNILQRFGKAIPRAIVAYRVLLKTKSYKIADNALFGVVFWQDPALLPEIETLLHTCSSEKLRTSLKLAVKSLKARDPFIFDPNYHDLDNVWRLDPKRFGDHIGAL